MTDYAAWRARHPEAARELEQMQCALPWPMAAENSGKSEAWAQQQVRLKIAQAGALSFRNNVGGTKTREHRQCPRCQFKYAENVPPLRWGLANDSAQLNRQLKSSDLILIIPRLITPADVGTTIGQFGAVEVKAPGWQFNATDEHLQAQQNWLSLINSKGGYVAFSTGDIDL